MEKELRIFGVFMDRKKLIVASMVCCMVLSAKAADYTITDSVVPAEINPGPNAGIAQVLNKDTLTITNSSFSNKEGYWSGGINLQNGGELNITGGTKVGEEIQNATTFSGNHNNAVWGGGGAISSYSGSKVTVGDYTSFVGNYTNNNNGGDSGGAIYTMDSTLNIGNNVTLSNNYATNKEVIDPVWGPASYGGKAGAIYVQNSEVTIGNDFKVDGNKSVYRGGAIATYGDNTTISIGTGAKFTNNTSLESNGGAISLKALHSPAIKLLPAELCIMQLMLISQ